MFHSVKWGTLTVLSGWIHLHTDHTGKENKWKMKVPDFILCLQSNKLGIHKKQNIYPFRAWCRKRHGRDSALRIYAKAREKPKRRRNKNGESDLMWSACCRLTWIHHLYLWRNSVPFCCPAENKWSFFRTLAASLELTGTLWSTEIGTSPSLLSTLHIRKALLQPAKSIWLMADFPPQLFFFLL